MDSAKKVTELARSGRIPESEACSKADKAAALIEELLAMMDELRSERRDGARLRGNELAARLMNSNEDLKDLIRRYGTEAPV